jgi:hypothetical protein
MIKFVVYPRIAIIAMTVEREEEVHQAATMYPREPGIALSRLYEGARFC